MKVKSIVRQATALILVYLIVMQSVLFGASPVNAAGAGGNNSSSASILFASLTNPVGDYIKQTYSWLADDNQRMEAENSALPQVSPLPETNIITDAAISRNRPSLNGGTINGNLRVFGGESYAINSQFHLNGDLYAVGTPNITVNSGASHGGTIAGGGSTAPAGYGITLNSGTILPGKIHTRADALSLPADIPSAVPNPAGTRYVNINSPSELSSIGSWATVRTLTVSPSNLTINVPPGNYDTLTANGGNIRFVFSAGTYNFSGTINLNGGSRVESNGQVTINIGQGLNINNGSYLLGANTAARDVKLNILGSSLTIDNGSQVNALVRAANANVNFNNGTLRGQIIANYLNINSGQVIGEAAAPADTTPPVLQITSPASNSTTQAAMINVSGTASDNSGIASVTVNGSPANYHPANGAWSFADLSLALGSNTVNVQATDTSGNTTTQSVSVTRELPPDTTPPSISITSPSNNTTTAAASVTISGTAADLGANAAGINRVMVNGVQAAYNDSNGIWTIGNVALNEGANTITAVAYDNAPSANTNQTSIVVTRRTPDTQAPVLQITAPVDGSESYESSISVSGTATDDGLNAAGVKSVAVNGQPAVYDALTNQWTASGVALAIGANTITVAAVDNADPANQTQAAITVTRREIPPPTVSINTPADNLTTTAETVTIAGLASAFSAGGNQISQVAVNGTTAQFDGASKTWTMLNFPLSLGSNTIIAKATDSGGRETTVQITVVRDPENQAPVVNAGLDQLIELPAAASLNGTGNDDGFPRGSALTFAWSKVGGAGEVSFSNPAELTTSAVFSEAGVYVLRLTASDGALSASDEIAITVNPENHPPVVSAGADQSIVLPDTATLNGTASDDGNPQGSSLALLWTKVSGEGAATFTDPASASTVAAFSEPGVYVLRLTATDSVFSVSSDVTVTVAPNPLIDATLTLSPTESGPNVTGSSQIMRAVLKNRIGQPIPNATIGFTIGGANTASGTALTNAGGLAEFTYTGTGSGLDTIRANALSGSIIVQSNEARITWVTPIQQVSTTTVTARFFAGSGNGYFDIPENRQPLFTQYFPTINFNPAPGTVNGSGASGVSTSTRPMVNVTTDFQGNYTGTIVSGGNGYRPGQNLHPSAATFSGNFLVKAAGEVTFDFFSDDGFMFGIGNGAVRVSGANTNLPASGLTPYLRLPLMGGFNAPSAPTARSITVYFPAAGTYPYEVDWSDCCYAELAMTLTTQTTGRGIAPLGSLALTPNTTGTVKALGRAQTLSVVARDASGTPLVNQPVSFNITGANQQQLNAVTGADGRASLEYTPAAAGLDKIQVTGEIPGMTMYSNVFEMEWRTNQPPTVFAGNNQTTYFPVNTLSLNGTVSDDNLPNNTLNIAWSKESGAGNVAFSNPTARNTQATFSAPGVYVLRLTAGDGELTASSSVTVTVNPELPNNPPVVEAGTDQTAAVGTSTASANYVMNADGSNVVRLTFNTSEDYIQGVSSTNSQILFISNRDGNNEIYVMNSDGSNQRRLTFNAASDHLASWSPDGSKIIFASNRTGNYDLFSMNADGSALTQLTNTPENEYNARWQPQGAGTNGGLIAYFRYAGNDTPNGDVWVMQTDGSNPTRLTTASGADDTPVWSPDGARIAFTSMRDGNREIYVMNSNGTSQQRLTNNSAENWVGDWSPDGTTLIEIGNQTGDYEIYLRRLSDANQQRLTFFPDADNPGFWSPDGSKIFFSSKRRGAYLRGTATDDGAPYGSQLSINWSRVSGPGTVSFSPSNQATTRATFTLPGTYLLKLSANDSRFLVEDTVAVQVVAALPNKPPVVSAGADQTIVIARPLQLRGTVGDDALPAGASVTQNWSLVSGPGTVTFETQSRPLTNVAFSLPGIYTLRLTASDSLLSASDEVVVRVNPPNAAPAVNAGADQAIELPNSANLSATLSDDGQPEGANLSLNWSKLSGPGSVVFGDAGSANTTANFSQSGVYVLRLTVSDTDLQSFDDVAVTVSAPTNQPPVVSPGAGQTITLPNNTATLNGSVTDDGLPNGNLTIQWTKTSGAGDAVFADSNSAQTAASFSAAGNYILRLTASDGNYTVWAETLIRVNPENHAPTVNAGADQTITLAQTAILEAAVSDDGLPAGGSFSALWTKVSGDGDVTFSNPNQTATYASFSQTGTYVLRLTVSDSELSASDDVTVTVAPTQSAPMVEILTPADGISITEPTAVTGTVSGGDWKLEYSLTDTDDPVNRVWTEFANGAGAASGILGTLDTTLMLNGLYDVRLSATDAYGQITADVISVAVERNLKIGHFTVSFDDMSVPVAGIPIQIIRTYDSRDKRKGDFGMGWTLGIKNVRVEKNKVLGLSWYQTKSNTFIPTYCIEPTRPHIVTVTMPDGTVEKFEARTERQCQQAAPIPETKLVFTPQGATRGQLSVAGDNTVFVAGSVPGPVELVAYDGTGIFDRTTFKYTAKDGTEFIIKQGAGLESVKDTNGNTLTVSANGITHSSGKSVTFQRDAQGRITQIADPAGKSNVYTYDANGDLVSYKDRENNTTLFTYEPTIAHHLKSIVDPLNRTPIRNEYDASGRLLKHTDANGNEIVYTHNLAERVEIVTDRLGNPTTFEYDSRGNVLKKRDALNNETLYSYDANDNVLTETNALGKTTTYTYDAQDNRTSVTDALGNKTEMTYNAKGQVLTVKDARGNVTTNTYDTAGNLLTTKDALNNLTTNVYSIQTGQLSSTKDAHNNVTTFEYVGNYLVKQIDAQNNETTFTYDANGNCKTQTVKRTNAAGQIETITMTFEYNNLNRLVKSIKPDGSFTLIEYDELGQQKATSDQSGNRTEFIYDTQGRLIKRNYADGKFEESTYDDEGRRLTSKDRSGKVIRFENDALGRLKKIIYADSTFTEMGYDAAGQLLTSTDARGNTTVYTYDDAGRRLSVKNALNQVTSFTYDANGNQLTMTDALNQTTTNVYDTLNRNTKTVFADNSFVETTFDELGRRTAEKDQAGKVTQFVYDSLGRLTKVKDALNQESRYEYNELGQQTKQIDALNRETKYEYDQLGRRVRRILPLGQTETYSYDTDGNLQSKTDFNGKTTTFAYDDMRRLLSKTPDASFNQPAVSYTYNALGQRATMTDASGTTVYSYDNRNRLASKQTPNGTLFYTYNDAGNIETLRSSNANGVSVDYDYDELNRLESVKDNRLTGNQTTNYTFDAVGNLESYSYPNQVTTSYAYNNLNRLTTMTVSNASGGLASYAYTLGAAGNRTQVVEGTDRTVNYVSDDLYRLTQETIANSANNGVVGYQYDAVGNRLQRTSNVNQVANQSSTYDANDRLGSDTYDANGNTKISNGKTYNYDFENKLTSTSDGITIVYDGDGNRVAKTVNGVTTHYLVDTNNLTGYAQVVEELQNGQVTKQYTYGLDLISQKTASIVSFYNYDGHGSVRNLTDSAGQITDSYDYDAFGTIVNRTGTTDNNYLYAGEQFDADLGFYYNRARYLNVETGRFISQDTYEGNKFEQKSLHKYLYVSSNPVNSIDPSGYVEMTIAGQLITVNIHSILSTMSSILAVVAVAAVACAVEAGATYALDIDPLSPCGVNRPKIKFYRGTTYYDALEAVATQRIDIGRILTNQTVNQFEPDRFGVYFTKQYSTAFWYADYSGGTENNPGYGGGPGIIVATVSEERFRVFAISRGIQVEVPVPRPPVPGQTETIIPFDAMLEFESFAKYSLG